MTILPWPTRFRGGRDATRPPVPTSTLVGGCCRVALIGAALVLPSLPAFAASTDAQWQELREENHWLREQVLSQQRQLDALRAQVEALASARATTVATVSDLRQEVEKHEEQLADASSGSPALTSAAMAAPAFGGSDNGVILSGQAGFAFFSGGDASAYPNDEFRVDDARLMLDARVRDGIYFYSEVDLALREANDEAVHLGEAYLELENVAPALGDRAANLRIGRIDIPFGLEYQFRDSFQNPLITHSLADIWGIDEGLELYGQRDRFSYVLALQNGGHPTLHDFNADKAITARIGYDLLPHWNVSVSAMRTGRLDREDDRMSELWFGGGFFRALGPEATTSTFAARLAQLDTSFHWAGGHLRAAAGQAWFDDDDRAADNRRRIRFFQVEAVQPLTRDLFVAGRFSRMSSDRGYPLVGLGDFGDFLFRSPPTSRLRRISVGLGWRYASGLLLKTEYSWEDGRFVTGAERGDTDQLSAEAAIRF